MESIGAVKHLAKITNNLEKRIENLENHHNNGLFDKIKILQFMIILMVFFTALWYWEWMVSDFSAIISNIFESFLRYSEATEWKFPFSLFFCFFSFALFKTASTAAHKTRERAKDSINARWIQIGSSVWCVVQLTELILLPLLFLSLSLFHLKIRFKNGTEKCPALEQLSNVVYKF